MATETDFTTLKIVSGNREVDLLDGINYALVEWSPAVAGRDTALLGNYDPYQEVVETITIDVFGTTRAAALDALDEINDLLEQAQAWRMGADVDPVILQAQLQGSTLSEPVSALIIGQTSRDRGWMALQPTFNQDLTIAEISGVALTFRRRGLWLGEEVVIESLTEYGNPAIMSADMTEPEKRLCPTSIEITGFDSGTPMIGSGFLIVTGVPAASSSGENVAIYTAADMTSEEFESVDDSANLAHGDDVMRIDAATDQTGSIVIGGVNANVTRISIFAAIRNNSSDTSWTVVPRSYGYVSVSDRERRIDTSTQDPRIIYVGSVANQVAQHLSLELEFSTTGSTGTLDVNYVVMVGHDESTNFIAIEGVEYSTESIERSLVVASRALTHRVPLLFIQTDD